MTITFPMTERPAHGRVGSGNYGGFSALPRVGMILHGARDYRVVSVMASPANRLNVVDYDGLLIGDGYVDLLLEEVP